MTLLSDICGYIAPGDFYFAGLMRLRAVSDDETHICRQEIAVMTSGIWPRTVQICKAFSLYVKYRTYLGMEVIGQEN